MKKINLLVALLCAMMISACVQHEEPGYNGPRTVITVCIGETKTSLGAQGKDGVWAIHWAPTDRIVMNGEPSETIVINEEDNDRAIFSFKGIMDGERFITFPYTEGSSCTAEQPTVVFPAYQKYVANSFDTNAAPMCGWSVNGEGRTTLKHLAGVMRFPFKGHIEGKSLRKIVITATADNAVLAGEYAVDCKTGEMTVIEGTTSNTVTYDFGEEGLPLSKTTATPVYITLPNGFFGPCEIAVTDTNDFTMLMSWNVKEEKPIRAGVVRMFNNITYKKGIHITIDPLDSEQDGIYNDKDADIEDLIISEEEIGADYIPGTVFGYIKDTAGNPIANVPVSDGFTITTTNEQGFYTMATTNDAYYIFYSSPAGYEIPLNDKGNPCFYKLYDPFLSRYDFTLKPQAVENKFTLFAFADPQVESSEEMVRFTKEALPKIQAHAAQYTDPCYGIVLGDVIQQSGSSNLENFMADMYHRFAKDNSGMPVFYTMGNHDHTFVNTSNPFTTDWRNSTFDLKAQRYFEKYFGPVNFSFDRGNAHIISMRNTIFNSETDQKNYSLGFTDAQLAWLQADLALVPNDKLVILCVHIPLYNRSVDTEGAEYKNVQAVLALLNQFPNVHILSGHTHHTRSYEHSLYSTPYTNIYEHNIAAVCGKWWRSNLNGDGAPLGYKVFEIEGNQMTNWYYQGFPEGMDSRDYQMRLYRGDAVTGADKGTKTGYYGYYKFNFGSDVLLANIFGCDSQWKVEVYEDDVKTGEMEWMYDDSLNAEDKSALKGHGVLADDPATEDVVETPFYLDVYSPRDMYAIGYHIGIMGAGAYTSGGLTKCWSMWKYTLTNPEATNIKVVATDRFGRQYECSTITEGTDYTLVTKPTH